jgi:hypothetical protein
VSILQRAGTESVTIVHSEGTEQETGVEVQAHIQPETGFFEGDAPVYEGDIVLVADPRGVSTYASLARSRSITSALRICATLR